MKNIGNIETVDKGRHARLKVKPNHPDYAHAKGLNMVGVTLAELSPCASNYVVMFIQNPGDPEFRMAVLLGLIPGENVYFARGGWDTTYVPLLVVSDPFMIGYDDRNDNEKSLTTCIDRASSSLSETDGMALFDDNGKETDFLMSRHALLNQLFEEDRHTDLFSRKMRELGLLKPFEVVLPRQDGNHRRFTGMYTLDQDKMKLLSNEQLQELHQLHYLPACYIILSSIYQINKLMVLRNQKLADKVDSFSIHFPSEPAP